MVVLVDNDERCSTFWGVVNAKNMQLATRRNPWIRSFLYFISMLF